MLSGMPWRVYREWALYAREEPFGQMALRLGYASASLGNLLAKPKHRRAWQPADFMPDAPLPAPQWTPAEAQQHADNQVAQVALLTRMLGGTVIDKRKKNARRD